MGVESLVHDSQSHTPIPSVMAQRPVSGKFNLVLKAVLLCLFCWFDMTMQNFFPVSLQQFLYEIWCLCPTHKCRFSCLPRYTLMFYAMDGTAEAKMFCFDSIAKQIIGKPCEFLVRTLSALLGTPSDLCAIVGLKFTFAVNININSYYAKERILNVNSILQVHGRQQMSMGFHVLP
jgi:hypothetical protein